jgi:thiol-disulfide isomerase/thioredoxin
MYIKKYAITWIKGVITTGVLMFSQPAISQNAPNDKQDGGILELKQAVESDIRNLEKHKAYTRAMILKGNEMAMDKQYAIWMKRFPKDAIIPLAIGSAYEGGENPKARPYLLKAVNLDPQLAEGWAALAGDAERWGNFTASRKYLEKAVEAEPDNLDILFQYAFAWEGVDDSKYRKLSLDLINRAPHQGRSSQALYWLANKSRDQKDKFRYWELLRKEYPIDQFDWTAYAMDEYFLDLLADNPSEAKVLAVEMAGKSRDEEKWKKSIELADQLSKASELIASGDGAAAGRILAKVELPRNSAFADELQLMKAKAEDISGHPAAAYDSTLIAFLKSPGEKLKQAYLTYGRKLGKDDTEMNSDLWTQISAIAKSATPFSLNNYLTGKKVSLNDFKGKVVLLTYWFPGCGPCRAEFPHFENVVRKFKGQDLVYLGINIVQKQNKFVVPFLKQSGYSFTPLEDIRGRDKGTLNNKGLAPINFLIDKNGRVVFSYFRTDAQNEKDLELMISMLLSGKIS